jgi:WhiB family redox-sensing transcriptional regulator
MTYTDNNDSARRPACLDEDPELFFPNGTTGPLIQAQVEEAKGVCARCPVMAQCRASSFAARIPYGVWGGIAEDERMAVLRRRDRQESTERARVRATELPAALSA